MVWAGIPLARSKLSRPVRSLQSKPRIAILQKGFHECSAGASQVHHAQVRTLIEIRIDLQIKIAIFAVVEGRSPRPLMIGTFCSNWTLGIGQVEWRSPKPLKIDRFPDIPLQFVQSAQLSPGGS